MGRWKKLDKTESMPAIESEADYLARLEAGQKRLRRVQQWAARERKRIVVAIEGWDASGKGGLIQRLTALLDPRHVAVWSIAAPTAEEQGRHWLWRFWQKLPAPGEIAIFDRTWYGRVLVERVEGFCDRPAWQRAYDEIDRFETTLVDDGVLLVKLLLHTSAEEQKRRIVDRMESAAKRYKVSMEDFRNIAKRAAYLEAYDDMLERTDSKQAPWHLVASDFKWRARVEAIDIISKTLSKDADLEFPPLDSRIAQAAFDLWGWRPTG